MNDIYLEEAIKIADPLTETSIGTRNGISWPTIGIVNDMPSSWKKSVDMYNGVSGIALFLLELYNITRNEKYLITAEEAMRWVEWHYKKYPFNYYAFLTGSMGISYVYLRFYAVTNKKTYLDKALKIVKKSVTFGKNAYISHDFLNGLSGTLLVLIHLHSATKKAWLLDAIEGYTEVLIKNAIFAKEGIYWDVNILKAQPLCGFAHGPSGIGYVFLELGHYFKNPAFYYVAEQAFAYENYIFNKNIKNWPHFGLPLPFKVYMQSLKKAYKESNYEVFNQIVDRSTWCYGALGIGLARIRTRQLLNNKIYKTDIVRAYKKIQSTKHNSFTLCHGNGGSAEFFLQMYTVSRNKKYLKYAKKIADDAIEQKKIKKKYAPGINVIKPQEPENPSLFLGTAGIGYFLLRLSFPDKVPSLLLPSISKTADESSLKKMNIRISFIRQVFINKIFPQTVHLVNLNASSQFSSYCDKLENIHEITNFKLFLHDLKLDANKELKEKILTIFAFELFKFEEKNKSNNAFLYIQHLHRKKEAKRILTVSEQQFLKMKLQLVPEATIYYLDQPVIILRTPGKIKEQAINDFCSTVFLAFQNKRQVKEVINEIIALYNFKDKDRINIINQIKEGILYGVLTKGSK